MFKFTKEEKKLFMRDTCFSKLNFGDSIFEVNSNYTGQYWLIERYNSEYPFYYL